ncbi:hypothetical protein SAMN02745216_03258 [Desulfatibacillum alkenivorans DSM 16219]|uniref:Uncharacterized protein n=1 Tax=Desulfatibacillum alkenivorans DSM 16219 TaxID=1121393 RepID=A0A1M6RH94_9BACT|nr:hypothetical protein [Desulfatibacillum alkenivorans]SHK31812.1 hypothetical protein SAMN02745216_03258 [Desulfatibacillum alkenivorans DSM 16219]
MSTVMPEGENIRRAVKFVGEFRSENPDAKPSVIVQEAAMRFDLNPAESEYLARLVRGEMSK